MSWYACIEEARKALKRKTKEFKEEFTVVKDTVIPRCYYVVRKTFQKDDEPPTPHAGT